VVEKIIDQRPDAIFLSPFENSGGYGKLEEIDIPLVECAEYMEKTPLGRAEWLRFYGILFGCEQKADSLFHVVDSNYNTLKAQATQRDGSFVISAMSQKNRPPVTVSASTAE
jgi:iron complex transport system substrate-binding protein